MDSLTEQAFLPLTMLQFILKGGSRPLVTFRHWTEREEAFSHDGWDMRAWILHDLQGEGKDNLSKRGKEGWMDGGEREKLWCGGWREGKRGGG